MPDIPPLSNSRPITPAYTKARSAAVDSANPQARPNDQVQLSQTAQMLAKLDEMPDVRLDLVNAVREQIDNGTYETPEKIDATVTTLLDEVA